jgi:hypothetical protein
MGRRIAGESEFSELSDPAHADKRGLSAVAQDETVFCNLFIVQERTPGSW